MIRTIFGFIYFSLYLISMIPKLWKVRKLEKAGRIAERDALVSKGVQDWAKMVVGLSGGTVSVVGEELVPVEGAVVFVGNHQSYFDIPILLGFIGKPKAFVSKIEIIKVPLLSDWMKLMQCSFMDRKDMRQSVRAIHEAIDSIKKGYSMVIFPEGTRSKGGPIGEFKAGSFKLALKAGVPVVPVTINGSWRLFEEKGVMKPDQVFVTVHPPIPTAGLTKEETEALPAKVQAIIESAMTH